MEWTLRRSELLKDFKQGREKFPGPDRSRWLQVFVQESDYELCADLGAVGPGGTVQVYRAPVKDVGEKVVAESLSELLDAWTALLAAGASWDGAMWRVPQGTDPELVRAAGY
ncbi:hypothetical protein [Nocardioides mangrovi]|uniref:MmcQ/YjbR family DNA-binding protein n=1 Tax=Nocardioides mangrovi TaxID=2874580 RepID=A0ABS7U7H1_9ACTN|nr:hypothetical protein [Nocardioides mangrovi]MBZ5736915.1 hypothetical protein [Nocardioides mangrovi]